MKRPPAAGTCRMFLVRHGATASNERVPFVLQGCEINGPLTDKGRGQATALAQFLQPFEISAAYSSSLVRARETAELVLAGRGIAVEPRQELRECSVGRWEGLDWDTIREQHSADHQLFFSDPAIHPHPGGESYGDVLRRVEPALRQIASQHNGENVLVVAHNLVNRIYLTGLLGVPLRDARRLKQSNTGLNIIEFHGEQVELLTMNSVLHLDEA